MAEWLGNRAINQKVAGSIPGPNNVVSLGKALHPACLGGMSLYLRHLAWLGIEPTTF